MSHTKKAATAETLGPDFFRPWLLAGAVALLVARPLLPSEGAIVSGDALLFVLLPLVLAAVWTLRAVMRGGTFVRCGAVDLAVLFLVVWHAASAIAALRTGAPRPAINSAWNWVALATMFLLVRQLVAGQRETRAMAAVMIALAVALSTFGFYQFFYSIPRDQAHYAADPEGAIAEAHVSAPAGSRQRLLFENRVNSSEPMATFVLANSLAGFLAPWLTTTLGICAMAFIVRSRNAWLWLPAAGCALLILACLILTKSRAAFVGSAVGILLLAAWTTAHGARMSRRIAMAALILVALLAAAAVAVGALDRQVLSEAGKSLGYRVQYWQASWALIREHPWFGCGPGQFQTYYTRYKLPEASETVADPHNFLLEVWATAGTPAAAALVAFLALVAWQVVRRPTADEEIEPSTLAPPFERNPGRRENRRKPSRSPSAGTSDSLATGARFWSNPGDATVHIFGGGAAGYVLAFLIGPLATVPLGVPALVGGLLTSAVAAAALYPWVVCGRITALLLGIAMVALLVNLLAGGGINFAGVAGSLWLLAALCMAMTDRWRRLTVLPAVIVLATAVTLCGTFYFTVYSPVLACNLALDRADTDPQRADAQLHAAAIADPLNFEPLNRLAALEWEHWNRYHSEATFKRIEAYIDRAMRLNPQSAPLAEQKGDMCFEVYRQSGNEEALALAAGAFQRAVDLHPNSISTRAKLAFALAEAGDAQQAAAQAAEALRLHDLTPHADQKLPDEFLERLRPLIDRPN
jgi:O-antigen ligase